MSTKAADYLVDGVAHFQSVFEGDLEVPAVSRNTMRVVDLCSDPGVSIDEAVEVIEMDPVLSAAALRVANSAMYGGQMPISLVRGAVMRLGLRWVANLAVTVAATKSVRCAASMYFDPDQHWENSLYRAVFAEQALSALPIRGKMPVFAAALLQDISMPLLANEHCLIYGPVLDQSHGRHRILVPTERVMLSWNHAEAGAWVASQWVLPEDMSIGIACHHLSREELKAFGAEQSPLAAVAFSGTLPDCCGATPEEISLFAEECRTIWGIDDSILAQMLRRTESTVSDLLSIFGLPSQRTPLIELFENGLPKS